MQRQRPSCYDRFDPATRALAGQGLLFLTNQAQPKTRTNNHATPTARPTGRKNQKDTRRKRPRPSAAEERPTRTDDPRGGATTASRRRIRRRHRRGRQAKPKKARVEEGHAQVVLVRGRSGLRDAPSAPDGRGVRPRPPLYAVAAQHRLAPPRDARGAPQRWVRRRRGVAARRTRRPTRPRPTSPPPRERKIHTPL